MYFILINTNMQIYESLCEAIGSGNGGVGWTIKLRPAESTKEIGP
jgi:hypothetical protein